MSDIAPKAANVAPLRPDGERRNLPRSAEGLSIALADLGYSVRKNVRSHRIEWSRDGEPFEASDDDLENWLQVEIEQRYVTGTKNAPLIFGARDGWPKYLGAILHQRRVDPFMEWLEALPPWDKEHRLETWLADCFKVDEGCKLTAWSSMFIPLGAVWRTYDPGTKLDEMPVLVGPQGCGKSTALQWLLPPENPEWFADGLNLAADSKNRTEALQGRVIVEASEMTGSTRAELESLKAFLSRRDDGAVRLAYRRNPETLLRRCVIAGSTNDAACLPNDPTGNRRFVIVNVAATDDGAAGVRQYLNRNRLQIWAEAWHLQQGMGIPAWLPDDLKAAQATVNEGYRHRDDILEYKLATWANSQTVPFTLAQAAEAIDMEAFGRSARLTMAESKRLAFALRALGYQRERAKQGGTRTYYWSKC